MWVLIVIFAGSSSIHQSTSGFSQEFNTPKVCIDAKAVIDGYKVDDEVRVVCLPKGGVK